MLKQHIKKNNSNFPIPTYIIQFKIIKSKKNDLTRTFLKLVISSVSCLKTFCMIYFLTACINVGINSVILIWDILNCGIKWFI